jgi:hypothetical protein
MDIERIIDDIEQLEEMFEAPDIRPLSARDLLATWDFHEAGNIVAMVLYWAVCNYVGNGQTPGKWAAWTRAVSLTSDRLGVWQSVEQALGYGAAVLNS